MHRNFGLTLLSDPTIARVYSMAREILAGRMPTASILMSRKNYGSM